MPDRSPDEPDPTAREAWRLVMVLYARMAAHLEQAAVAAGTVPLTWFEVLATLGRTPGRRMRLRDLADAVLLTRAGLTRVLDRVEAGGLIRREKCPADGRGSEAVLTDAGLAALRRAWPVNRRVVQERFAAHLPPAAAAAVVDALRPVLLANDWLPEGRPVTITVPPRAAGGGGGRKRPPDPSPGRQKH